MNNWYTIAGVGLYILVVLGACLYIIITERIEDTKMRTLDADELRYTVTCWRDSNSHTMYKASARHHTTGCVGIGRGATQHEARQAALADLLTKMRHDGPVHIHHNPDGDTETRNS